MDCASCIFADIDDTGTQRGCHALRLSKLIDRGEASLDPKEYFYKLSRTCNIKREVAWSKSKTDPKYQPYSSLEIAQREVEPTFGVVIYDDSEDEKSIDKICNNVKNINYNKNKYTVVWSVCEEALRNKGMSILDAVTVVQHMKINGYKMWLNIHKDTSDVSSRDKECFTKVVQRSYWLKTTDGTQIPSEVFNDINSSVNDRLETIVLFGNKDHTLSIVPASVAQLRYLDHRNYDLMVDGLRSEAQERNLYLEINETQ